MKYVIIREMMWYHRLWHKVLTLLGKECYAGEVLKKDLWRLEIDQMFLCPGCWEYKSWDCGCAHEDPKLARLCDDCFVKGGHLAEKAD